MSDYDSQWLHYFLMFVFACVPPTAFAFSPPSQRQQVPPPPVRGLSCPSRSTSSRLLSSPLCILILQDEGIIKGHGNLMQTNV
jgi:hypothetical protein